MSVEFLVWSLVRDSKPKTRNLAVSSVCPRDVSDDVTTHIDAVNAGLQVMCAEENVHS